ncbi:hypothetical protein M8J75_008547 [Diaphorina citri]|nr:hypothetical protein M8J75_008547 [Diaphorina citri]
MVLTNIPDIRRYFDTTVRLRNPNLELLDQDILYHLGLGSESHDLVEMFGDIKFVCMAGTPKRCETFSHYIMKELGHKLPTGTRLQDICEYSYRYSMYKVGPVLSVSHGMGIPSVARYGYPVGWYPTTRSDQANVPRQSAGPYILQDRNQWRRGTGGRNGGHFGGGGRRPAQTDTGTASPRQDSAAASIVGQETTT